MNLPTFKYHPDPISTGSIIESSAKCICCQKAPGFIYSATVYASDENEYDECICPWCIADGSAHTKLKINFTEVESIGGCGTCNVSKEILEEVAYRTPSFNGWEQEQWWTHCNDAGQFLGAVGKAELEAFGPQAIKAIQEYTGLPDDAEWQTFFAKLNKDQSPTAYVFQCLHCKQFGSYEDSED